MFSGWRERKRKRVEFRVATDITQLDK